MKVAIDARGVHSRLQGIGRHVLNLLLGLSTRESDLEFLVLYTDPLARKLVERSGGPYRGRFQWIKTMAAQNQLLERAEIPWLLKIHKADLFHDVAATGVWTGLPTISTVHELSGLHFDSHTDSEKIRKAVKDSRLIIAVSNSVAEEIESHFNISRPRIRVIANAIDPYYTERVNDKEIRAMRERFKLPNAYFLCVTAERASKNAKFVQKIAENWRGPEHWVFTMPGQSTDRIRYLDIVEDAWLRPLYTASTALIAPSKYEGFSLPPIEALAAGTLPVVSDIAPHRELLGDVLTKELFFDPETEASLERALRSVVDAKESTLAAVLEKFRLVRDRYSYAERAEQVQAVYREALKG